MPCRCSFFNDFKATQTVSVLRGSKFHWDLIQHPIPDVSLLGRPQNSRVSNSSDAFVAEPRYSRQDTGTQLCLHRTAFSTPTKRQQPSSFPAATQQALQKTLINIQGLSDCQGEVIECASTDLYCGHDLFKPHSNFLFNCHGKRSGPNLDGLCHEVGKPHLNDRREKRERGTTSRTVILVNGVTTVSRCP